MTLGGRAQSAVAKVGGHSKGKGVIQDNKLLAFIEEKKTTDMMKKGEGGGGVGGLGGSLFEKEKKKGGRTRGGPPYDAEERRKGPYTPGSVYAAHWEKRAIYKKQTL